MKNKVKSKGKFISPAPREIGIQELAIFRWKYGGY